MTPQTNTEVAGCLLDGVTADIWTDAHECTDQIAQTQDAMAEAAHRLGQMDDLVAKERAARIAAQTENEALKDRLARSGLARRATLEAVREAVKAEREACAKACLDVYGVEAIRARGAA